MSTATRLGSFENVQRDAPAEPCPQHRWAQQPHQPPRQPLARQGPATRFRTQKSASTSAPKIVTPGSASSCIASTSATPVSSSRPKSQPHFSPRPLQLRCQCPCLPCRPPARASACRMRQSAPVSTVVRPGLGSSWFAFISAATASPPPPPPKHQRQHRLHVLIHCYCPQAPA